MQRLMRSRALRGTHDPAVASTRPPRNLHYGSLLGAGAPRWSDHDRPEEFNFARDVVDHWTQLDTVGGPLGGSQGCSRPWEAEGHGTTTAPASAPQIRGESQFWGASAAPGHCLCGFSL